MARRKTQDDEASIESATSRTLESAMLELGQIVAELESGQGTLDDSLASFERGMGLLRVCHQQLDAAAQRIEIVTRVSADGEVVTSPFDAAATLEKSVSQARGSTGTRRSSSDANNPDPTTLFD